MKWTSNAEWPREVCSTGVSVDVHDTMEQALAVCSRLEREGFGGDRVHFPLRTWAEEVVEQTTPEPLDLSTFEGMTPGPWVSEGGHVVARNHNGTLRRTNSVAKVFPETWPLTEEAQANARAIAALPDIIAELRRLREEVAEQRAEIAQREILEAESVGERDKLRARIATLEAQVEEMGRDKARLDWLIKQGPPGAAEGIGLNEDAWEFATGFVDDDKNNADNRCIRAAIDAATAKGEQG